MRAGLFASIARFADSSAGWSTHARPLLDRLFARWIPPRPDESLGWTADADWARLDQEPLRGLQPVAEMLGLVLGPGTVVDPDAARVNASPAGN